MPLDRGTRLGPYEITAPLGAGGMGEVYRALDTKLDRDVAIKVLPAHLSADPEALARFEREAKAVAALSHPNIVSIFHFGVHGETAYAVMELLEGETLRQRLRGGALPMREAVEYAVQIAAGLAAAHAKGIAHRDVKPENVFIAREGRVKVLDFGLARPNVPSTGRNGEQLPTVSVQTAPGTVLGTVGYMSPEQVRGDAADHRSDLFCFGCVLYEMLSGQRAFQRATAAETLTAILREDPPELGGPAVAIPPGLERIVKRCLEKRPEERFESARDLVFALESTSAADASLSVPSTRPAAAPSVAVLPFVNMSGDPSNEYFSDGITGEILNALAQVPGLNVVARTSAFQFKGQSLDLREVGRRLGVAHVLEGSVQRAGNDVRITAQLIDAGSGYHLWSAKYDRRLENIFAVEDEISHAITAALQVKLARGSGTTLVKPTTASTEAHDLYLRGHALTLQSTFESLNAALELFRMAIALDPGFAPAYAGIANAYQFLADAHMAPRDVIPKSEAAARKAVELDESLPEARAVLGSLFQWNLDFVSSRVELQRAIALAPHHPAVSFGHCVYLLLAEGAPEDALDVVDRALALDPLNPLLYYARALCFMTLGELDKILDDARKLEEIAPGFFYYDRLACMAYRGLGRFADAVREYETIQAALGDQPLFGLAIAKARLGEMEAARDILRRLEERSSHQYVPPEQIALVHAAMGDSDRAFEWLDRALEAQSAWLVVGVQALPDFAPLRSDPRYEALIRRMKFPSPKKRGS